MATITAQILVGSAHPNDGGINPTHSIFLSEGSKPALVLVNQALDRQNQNDNVNITWIPTLENMLEDAILMLSIHVLRNGELLDLAKSFCGEVEKSYLELYEELSDAQRAKLYEICKVQKYSFKLAISVFPQSSFERHLQILDEYKMDVDVCCATYSRWYSDWTCETRTHGSLPQI